MASGASSLGQYYIYQNQVNDFSKVPVYTRSEIATREI